MKVPYIPEDSPFSGEQKAWLSGFLAGLHSRLSLKGQSGEVAASAAQRVAPPLHILFGTQTGNSEMVAGDMAAAARAHGMEPVVKELDAVSMQELSGIRRAMIVTSTYGEGEMPDNAQLFWTALAADNAPRLEALSFSVLALGDTGYDGFCQAGKLIDMRLEQLGARRLSARVDCDIDYEDKAAGWISEALPLAAAVEGQAGSERAPPVSAPAPAPKKSEWTRKNPFPATLSVNRLLSASGSAKEIRHYEFDLAGSGLVYEAGDALGVMPINDPVLVDAFLERLKVDTDRVPSGFDQPIGHLLAHAFEISTPSRELVTEIERRAGDEELTHVLRNGDKEALDAWLWGRDVLDLVSLKPGLLGADELLPLLRPLQHRAYSISSSALAHPGSVHLTVASVRYSNGGRDRGGVCSTFLADRVEAQGKAGIFVSQNKSFRVPASGDAPMIMIGPGTGLAPFRAFLQERRHTGAKGPNWLFFGDQRRASDFIYEDEMSAMSRDGTLTRLDLAFSRDQDEKIYVQTRMRENGAELFRWLEEGGHFYVCGDATRMAKDVDDALHQVIGAHGSLSDDRAAQYVANLKREKRYLRDVY